MSSARAIFINYRRSTTAAAAGRLHDRLEHHFARQDLFMDVDAIEPGLDFVKILNDQVNNCRAFIAVIGPNWASVSDASGRRRLDNPDDYVRIEIEAALERNVLVIPVLVDGAQMPTAMELPSSLKPLTRRQAIELSHARFASDVDLLANSIKRVDQEISTKTTTPLDRAQNASLSMIQILFSYRGRISRAAFWKGLTLYLAMVLSLSILLTAYFIIDRLDAGKTIDLSVYDNWRYKFLIYIISIPFYWPFFALMLKRLHRTGMATVFDTRADYFY
jgi:TIR domain